MAHSVRLAGIREDGERTWLVDANWWPARGLLGHKYFRPTKGSPGYEADVGATLTLIQARELNDSFNSDWDRAYADKLAERLADDNAEKTHRVEVWVYEWESGM